MNSEKMLVKETGEILNTTNNEFEIKLMSFSFEFRKLCVENDLGDISEDGEEELTYVHSGDSKTDREGKYYTGDNGETYHESEVVVGLDEIREYKIKNNLEI